MDVLTQGLAGAVLAAAAAAPARVRVAAAIGFGAGLLADADILIRAADDPLFNLEYHRHFTHALVFVPVGALLAALLAWPLVRRRLGFPAAYGYALLGYLPSGLLDACTSYGTQLLWPFADTRIAWNLIAIVDPLFTLALATGVALAAARRQPWAARAGLALALLYLLAGYVQRERAEAAIRAIAAARGHLIERIEVKPTLGNLVLWRSIYLSGAAFHVDAVRVGAGVRHYPGGSLARFTPAALPGLDPQSVLARDIARFTRFSDGYVARHPYRPEVLGDVRYAMRPHGTEPLWGIVIDPAQPQRHVEFRTFRAFPPGARREFLAMLRGRPLAAAD